MPDSDLMVKVHSSQGNFQSFRKSFFATLHSLILFSLFTSCATIQREMPAKDPLVLETVENTPTPEAYYHTILGLQFEKEENDPAALREYLEALQDDPNAVFLLTRAAILLNRIGNQKDALFYAERALERRPLDTRILNLIGNIYLASGQIKKASSAYERIIQIQPSDTDAYFSLAGIYANEGSLDKAEEMVWKGVEAEPSSPLGYYYLGKISVEKKALEKGLGYFQKALSLNPLFEHAYLEVALVYELQEKPKDAANVYRHMIEKVNPGSREAVTRLVQLLIEEKSLDEALTLLDDLAQKDPSNLDIPLQTALVWVEKKAFSEAIEKLLSVINARPEDVRLRIYLASLYEENKEYEKAVSTYQEVLKKDTNAYDVRIRLGSLYFYKLKQAPNALSQGESARKIDPKRPESYLFNGLVLHELNRYEEAAEHFIDGIEKNPKLPDLHFHLGATYDKLNRFEDLVKEMEKTIALDSKHANALNYLGYTFAEKGIRLNEAIDLINRALIVRPNDGYFIDSLGWAFYKKGMIPDAVAALQKAVSLVPDDPVIHEHLGEVYLKDNRTDLAKEAWAQSLRLDPKNEKLATRFRQAGFGDPTSEDRPQRTKNLPQNIPTETLNQKEIPMDLAH